MKDERFILHPSALRLNSRSKANWEHARDDQNDGDKMRMTTIAQAMMLNTRPLTKAAHPAACH